MENSPHISSTSEWARLESEVYNLRCVLDEERAVLKGKISRLKSCVEMLTSELEIKSKKEWIFLHQIDNMQKSNNHEKVRRQRLSYDKAALQRQPKRRSEQLHIAETQLLELSATESHNSSMDDFPSSPTPEIKYVIERPDSVSRVREMDDDTPEAAPSKKIKRAGSFRSV